MTESGADDDKKKMKMTAVVEIKSNPPPHSHTHKYNQHSYALLYRPIQIHITWGNSPASPAEPQRSTGIIDK